MRATSGRPCRELAHALGVARVLGHAYRQRTHAAQRQPGIVGADRVAHGVLRAVQALRHGLVIGNHRAQHQVGVAAHVLGAGDHRNLRAQFQRAIDVARAPGVVGGQHQLVAARELGQRGQIQHLEQQRPRRLDIQQAGVGTHQRLQVVAGREEGQLDTHALEHRVVQFVDRAIDAIGHQRMLAGRQQRQKRHRDGAHARRRQVAVRAGFQLLEHVFQRRMRIHAHPAIGHGPVAAGLAALRLFQRGQVTKAHRAGAHRRQVDRGGAGIGVEGRGAQVLEQGVDVAGFVGHVRVGK